MNSHDDSSENTELPIRRRRSFLATRRDDSLAVDTIPMATKETAAEDDIPVLTEVVTTDQDKGAPPEDECKPDFSASFDARLEELAAQMAEAIGRQMASELPTLIEATLLNASEDLRTGITATMETALRDFSARRKQLQLPLDASDMESKAPY